MGTIRALSFEPDGRAVVMGSWDRQTVRRWDAGKALGPPVLHTDWVPLIALSTNGCRMMSMMSWNMDGQVQELDVAPSLAGEPEQIERWIEGLTGLELDPAGAIRKLDAAALGQRRVRLQQLGGSLDRP